MPRSIDGHGSVSVRKPPPDAFRPVTPSATARVEAGSDYRSTTRSTPACSDCVPDAVVSYTDVAASA